jgi:hypothetical protein
VHAWAGRTSRHRRRFARIAWLAVVALLLDALLPAALAVAAPLDRQAPNGAYCGAIGHGPGSNRTPATAPRHHCIFCLVAAAGTAPPTVPAMTTWPSAALPAGDDLRRHGLPRQRAAFASAQPRGPPVGG